MRYLSTIGNLQIQVLFADSRLAVKEDLDL